MNKRQFSQPSPPQERSGFASAVLPTMLRSSYDGARWGPIDAVPYAALNLSPMSRVLHYGQSVFEGMKVVRGPHGPAIFRPRDHFERFKCSARRMCIPEVDVDALMEATMAIIATLGEAVPASPGFLYVRPFAFCADEGLAPDASVSYELRVLFLPVAPLFDSSATARLLRLTTNRSFTRAAPGGTGAVKTAANYASTMLPKRIAMEAGFDEVLWLDAREGRFVEETGSMNVLFVIDGVLVSPPVGDTVLPGVTRATLLALARDLDIPTQERPVAIDAVEWQRVTEVFGAGTAAGTAAVGWVEHEGRVLFERRSRGPICSVLSETYDAVLRGRIESPSEWHAICLPQPAAHARARESVLPR